MMIKRITAGLLALLLMGATILAQESQITPPANVPVNAINKAAGIELPADQVVAPDEGFVSITATCKGQVKWLVISSVKVKFLPNDANNSVIVSIPPTAGSTVTVFAVGVVDNKLTEFVRTTISVNGPAPLPPGPSPNPAPIAGKFHLTFVVDVNNATPELATLLNSPALRKAVSDKGGFLRIYDKSDKVVVQRKLDGLVQKAGGGPTMVLQSPSGEVYNTDQLLVPRSDQDVIAILNRYVR